MSSDRHQEAVSILNMFILDAMVGLRSLDIFSAIDDKRPLSVNMRAGLSRLSTTHLILALAKWMEFYERYKSLIPQSTAATAKTVYSNLKTRGVRDFRNKVVGHIWDKDVGKPLSKEDMQERLARVIGPDEEAFNRWIYNPSATDPTSHLVGLTEEIRDALRTKGATL
jgi:hypothetical protein